VFSVQAKDIRSMNRVEKLLAVAGGNLEADLGADAFDLRVGQR